MSHSLKEFAQKCLEVHNDFRRTHGVPDLKINDQLTAEAKKFLINFTLNVAFYKSF